MTEGQRVVLGAALLLATVVGLWRWASDSPAPPADTAADQLEDPHAQALLRIEASRSRPQADDPEMRWLEGELRYLLTRSQVALARPQGPYAVDEGTALFTLRVTSGEEPGSPMTLSLLNSAGQIERTTTVDSSDKTRLGLMRALAKELPSFLPRGDTGVLPGQFLGTEDTQAYEALAQVQMAAQEGGQIQQAWLRTRDTPIDRLEAVTQRYPDFARAWAELALLYLGIAGQDEASLAAAAEKSARQALSLDPRLTTAHAALGISLQRRGQWLLADESLTRALSLDSALRPALDAFGCLLVDVGRIDYALLIGEQATASTDSGTSSGSCLEYARMSVSTPPDSPAEPGGAAATRPRALAALLAARTDEAGLQLGAITGNTVREASWFTAVTRALGEPRRKPEALRAITLAASDGTLDPATEIMLGIALAEPDFVFNRMLRLRAEHKEVPSRFLWLEEAQFLRKHARFAAVTEQLGLKAYWQERELPDLCRNPPHAVICG